MLIPDLVDDPPAPPHSISLSDSGSTPYQPSPFFINSPVVFDSGKTALSGSKQDVRRDRLAQMDIEDVLGLNGLSRQLG